VWPQPKSNHWAKIGLTTLFGTFVDGLHHRLQTTAPAAGVQVQHLKLTDLVFADDTCLLAGSPQLVQAQFLPWSIIVPHCAWTSVGQRQR